MASNKYSYILPITTWLFRIFCGGLFIFSGFVKAIDPWGTIFKVEEYLGAFGVALPLALQRMAVFALCAVEFVVGAFLFLGCFRKSCPIFGALIMTFMLPLTLWIAMRDPVADCGCFGDALVLSNWLTFWKNVVLSLGMIWLIRFNISAVCLITPAFQWLAVVASGIFIAVIEMFGFFYQPLIDFRDYPVGGKLFATEDEDDDHGINVFDLETWEDKNEEASAGEGKELLVMIPKVSYVSPATTWKLNSLYEWAQENGVKMVGIVSGSPEEIEEWKDLSMAEYPLFVADDSSIKEVVRGNPGIVYMDNGKIIWKATLSSIDIDDFLSPDVTTDAATFGGDNDRILRNCAGVYLIFMAFLIFISFTPKMARLLTKGGLASKIGVRHHDHQKN